MQMGLGWVPDPESGPNHVRTATPGELAAEINRLHDELQREKLAANCWRALMSSGRLRMMGWTGFGNPKEGRPPDTDGYRHMGMEFWTVFNTDRGSPAVREIVARENVQARGILQQYVTERMRQIEQSRIG